MCETHENTFISLANIKPFLYVPPILTISHLLVVFPRCGYRLEFARLVGRIFSEGHQPGPVQNGFTKIVETCAPLIFGYLVSDVIMELVEQDLRTSWTRVLSFLERVFLGWMRFRAPSMSIVRWIKFKLKKKTLKQNQIIKQHEWKTFLHKNTTKSFFYFFDSKRKIKTHNVRIKSKHTVSPNLL